LASLVSGPSGMRPRPSPPSLRDGRGPEVWLGRLPILSVRPRHIAEHVGLTFARVGRQLLPSGTLQFGVSHEGAGLATEKNGLHRPPGGRRALNSIRSPQRVSIKSISKLSMSISAPLRLQWRDRSPPPASWRSAPGPAGRRDWRASNPASGRNPTWSALRGSAQAHRARRSALGVGSTFRISLARSPTWRSALLSLHYCNAPDMSA